MDTVELGASSSTEDLKQVKKNLGGVDSFLIDTGAAGTQLAGDVGFALLTGGRGAGRRRRHSGRGREPGEPCAVPCGTHRRRGRRSRDPVIPLRHKRPYRAPQSG